MAAIRNRFGWLAMLACVAVASFLGVKASRSASASSVQRAYRIGFGVFPPYLVTAKGDEPSGFAVEVVREATKRIGMNVEWQRIKTTTEAALTGGEIDLYPMLESMKNRGLTRLPPAPPHRSWVARTPPSTI